MFCVMANPRSGSTALSEAICAATGLKQMAEPFNPESYRWDDTFTGFETVKEKFDKIKKSNVDFFKTVTYYKWDTVKDSENLIRMCVGEFSTLFLIRSDFFSCTLSNIIAQKTGGWNIKMLPPEYKKVVSELEIDEEYFISQYEYTREMILVYRKLLESNINLFNRAVEHECLFGEEIYEQTFLQIEVVTGPLNRDDFRKELARHKINGAEVLQSVRNYEELKCCV